MKNTKKSSKENKSNQISKDNDKSKTKYDGRDNKNIYSWRVAHEMSPDGKPRPGFAHRPASAPATPGSYSEEESGSKPLTISVTNRYMRPPSSPLSSSPVLPSMEDNFELFGQDMDSEPRTPDSRSPFFQSGTPTSPNSNDNSRLSDRPDTPDTVQRKHWTELADNLNKVVDEFYEICETDFNVDACNEVIQALSKYQEDFSKLIEKIGAISTFEAKTQEPKPRSVAWQERKSSTSPLRSSANREPEKEAVPLPPVYKRLMTEKRKKSPLETLLEQEKRQAEAEKKREQFKTERKDKARVISDRSKTINEWQHSKRTKAKEAFQEKLDKADQIHDQHIQSIKKKAETENSKVDEVAFITKLSKENKKISYQRRMEETNLRRLELLEERKRKAEENAAKEEAALERKKIFEKEKLQRKSPVNKRTDTSSNNTPSSSSSLITRRIKRICKYCEIEIPSDDFVETHVKGKKHRQAIEKAGASNEDSKHIFLTIPMDPILVAGGLTDTLSESDQLRMKNMRKQAKTIKKRLVTMAMDYTEPHPVKESQHKARMLKMKDDLKMTSKNYPQMEKTLNEFIKMLSPVKNGHTELNQHVFRQIDGIEMVVKIASQEAKIPSSLILAAVKVLLLACQQNQVNISYMILCNKLVPLINLFERSLDDVEPFHCQLMTLLTLILWQPAEGELAQQMKNEIICYIVNLCTLDKLRMKLAEFLPLLEADDEVEEFIERACEFIEALTTVASRPVYSNTNPSHVAQLLVSAVRNTHFVGLVSLLTTLLLQKGPLRSGQVPEILPRNFSVVSTCIKILNNIAGLDLFFVQTFLGSDDYQVEIFHLLNYLLAYCTGDNTTPLFNSEPSTARATNNTVTVEKKMKLLNELILMIGYYTLQNERNQEILQWGKNPSILNRLCALPFQYFSDARYKHVLFPTLISACFMNSMNTEVLQHEMNMQFIVDYIKEESHAISITTEPKEKDSISPLRIPPRLHFINRFPSSLWDQTANYFANFGVVKTPAPVVEAQPPVSNSENLPEQKPQPTENEVQEIGQAAIPATTPQ